MSIMKICSKCIQYNKTIVQEANQRCSFCFKNISFKAIIQNIPQGYRVFEIILKGEQKQYLVICHKSKF